MVIQELLWKNNRNNNTICVLFIRQQNEAQHNSLVGGSFVLANQILM